MQKYKSNNIYQNNKSTTSSDKCVESMQFIVTIFDY